jgi:phosphoglycerol transferase MdoB-like AlkP superfamily enzyme
MKRKVKELLNQYLLIILAFLPGVFLVRMAEFLSLNFLHAVPGNTWVMELSGYLLDNLVFLSFSLLLAIPCFLLSLLHKKTGRILFFGILMIYTLVSFSLVKYFTTTLVPLDQVIFFFTPQEQFSIVLSSTRFDVATLIAFVVILSSPFITRYFIRNAAIPNPLMILLMIILLSSLLLVKLFSPLQVNYQNDFEYFVRINKPIYLVNKVLLYKSGKKVIKENDRSFKGMVDRYHYDNPQFSYVNRNYPLLRVDMTPDVLGPFFNFGKEKPNFVFIIVESLSTTFCGKDPYYGSFMPFLDSLIGKSLYWNNFLSTAERTFNVLPAVFGSLPFSDGEFYLNRNPPLHFSLIRYLKENGYFTTFYYGGAPTFSGYDNFMKHESIDLIMTHFGQNLSNYIIMEKSWEWGHPDGDLYKRSFEVMDSLKKSPRLDIYLTLSSHAPFKPPDEERYHQEFDRRVSQMKLRPDIKKMVEVQRDIFSTIIYTDRSLKEFFDTYRKREDFKNTVFIITGDHAMPELNATYLSLIGKYHVPLIIYSEMLKKPVWLKSVSSHNDITPSILAMLKSRGFISTRPVCHWLGQGLDVSEDFRNSRTVSFIYNNGQQAEYINGMNFLSSDRLYRVLNGLKLQKVNNVPVAERLKREQQDYLSITDEIAKKNIVIPEDLYFGGNYLVEPYLLSNSYKFNGTKSADLYISLIPNQKVNDEFAFLKIDLSIKTESQSADTSKLPLLIFQLLDDQSQNHRWLQFPMEKIRYSDNNFRLQLSKYIDLSMLRDIGSKTMKIYLLNNEKQQLILDDLQLDMTKIKLKNIVKKEKE